MALRQFVANTNRGSLLKVMTKLCFDRRYCIQRSTTANSVAELPAPGMVKGSSALKPSVPWLEKPSVIFSAKALKHGWGAIPIIIITIVGLTLEVLAIGRLAITRDDVYYTKKAACDYIETRPCYKAPVRKFLVFNQKYENPPDLIKAIQGDVSGGSNPLGKEQGYIVSKKALIAHAISSLTVIYLAAVV